MKKYAYTIILLAITVGCTDLDMNPLASASSENWYKNSEQVKMSINDLYKNAFWGNDSPSWTDDWMRREELTPITSATVNSEWGTAEALWKNSYKAIARANTVINKLSSDKLNVDEGTTQRYLGEAKFIRAYQYAKLISHFGNVIYYTNKINLDDSYSVVRTNKEEILQKIYEDYDFAILNLPEKYSDSELSRATKGAALAFKARIALYSEDWETVKETTKRIMESGNYSLYPDFGELFLISPIENDEIIYSIPRSEEFGVYSGVRWYLPRNAGGWAGNNPSWDLFASFLCTDGLPIDESPLFDPSKPFENRDPRLSETIVPFGTSWLGYIYTPHPDSMKVLEVNSGEYVTNNDSRAVNQYSSFNGLVWKKGIDESWGGDYKDDSDIILIRYADVLLMYAEAKIELGDIDQSVLDAINKVRARAYGASLSSKADYPTVKAKDKEKLRKILRIERRMEFSREGLRYMDIIRWKLAEKVLNKPNYGLLNIDNLQEKIINPGLWFFPYTPEIDKDGIADFSKMADEGLIKKVTDRKFDASKQYLWPIPASEILINDAIKQNPGY